jgi:hypothetical protein
MDDKNEATSKCVVVASFEYPGVSITWLDEGGQQVITRHLQYDLEGGCFEHIQPEVILEPDMTAARDRFLNWVYGYLIQEIRILGVCHPDCRR